jgi:hypothetical protein
VDGIIRRCVSKIEQQSIIRDCHASPYGGHHAGQRTAAKVLQSGFYWPILFKDCAEFVKVCDKCQRVGNIGRTIWFLLAYFILYLLSLLMFVDLTLWDHSQRQQLSILTF